MNQYLPFIITKLMFLTAPVLAQKTTGISMKWEIAAQLPADSGQQTALGVAGPVTSIHKGVLFIAGGANFPDAMPWQGGTKKFHVTIHVYSAKHRKLTLLKKPFSLPQPIAYAATCNTPDGVLYAGGENEKGMSDKAWLMIWDDKTEEILFKKLPPLPFPVSNAAVTLIGNTVYLAGGETVANTSMQFLSLDLSNISIGWKNLADIPQPVSHTVMTYSSGKKGDKIYLCGGRKKNSNGISDLYNNVFVYDVAANKWEEKKALPYALSAGTGMMINANNIILFGGDKGIVFNKTEKLIAAINVEKDPIKKRELILEKNKLQSEHPGFSREVLLYNVKNDTWKIIGTIPFDTPVTTTAVKWKSGVIIPSGEIKAGIRSPKILTVKIQQKNK
ncbi:kelch repeat-containing protein [Ferruginibacter sp.]